MFSKGEKFKVQVTPSLLSADFANLKDEIKHVTDAGMERIHIEVVDGVFSPEIQIGAPVVKSLRKVTSAIIEVHLMTVHPERKIEAFAKAGADIIICHLEATDQAEAVLQQIKNSESKAGIAINLGYGGQRLIKRTLQKIKRFHEIIRENNQDCELEADGGINIETAASVREAGANILVAGTAIYDSTDVFASLSKILGEEE